MTNPNLKQHTSSICIVGAGFVGATAAYCIMQQDVSADITLVDINDDMAEGQTLDLEDTQFISQTKIHHGLLKDAGKADVIVITAGVRQRPNEPRSALLERNAVVMRSIVNGMKPIREDAIILVVSNPCDVLTYVVWKASGLPSTQVFGSGTFLDSMRLRSYLSKELEANENSIHAFVLGEHGDNQFIAWSAASVGCSKLISGNFEKPFSKQFREKVEYETMRKAYSIIKLKGATYYGIASCISSLCQSVLFNEKYIRPVSVYDHEKGVVLSWPCTIGRRGVEKIMPLQLNESEQKKLSHAVNELQKSISVVSNT